MNTQEITKEWLLSEGYLEEPNYKGEFFRGLVKLMNLNGTWLLDNGFGWVMTDREELEKLHRVMFQNVALSYKSAELPRVLIVNSTDFAFCGLDYTAGKNILVGPGPDIGRISEKDLTPKYYEKFFTDLKEFESMQERTRKDAFELIEKYELKMPDGIPERPNRQQRRNVQKEQSKADKVAKREAEARGYAKGVKRRKKNRRNKRK